MAEAHFWSTIWFVISEKKITIFKVSRGEYVHQNSKLDTQNCALVFLILSTLKLPLYGVVVRNDANNYIPKEDRIFKAFLKENHDVLWRQTVEYGMEHVVGSVYGVFIH